MDSAIVSRPTLDRLCALHAPEARRLAYLLVGDRAQAEDISQEAFVRVLGRYGDLRNPRAFRAYLMRTVVSLSKNHFRRRALERRHSPPPAEAVQPQERDDELLDALRRLPPRQRAAVVLRYCEDLPEDETAEILHTSSKAVRSLVTRGLTALRKEIGT